MSARVLDDAELTPIHRENAARFKRDDLFQPYDDVPVSGGKVRQARRLLERHEDRIRRVYGGVILSPLGVHSPHGLILARVAKEHGFRVVLFIGATTTARALQRHAMLRRALALGARIDASTPVAYERALERTIARWQDAHGQGFVYRRFGVTSVLERDAILGGTSAQVANLPLDVERVIVPVGAGLTAAAVILGVRAQRPDLRVVCVQVAGYDRRETIDQLVGGVGGYDWHEIRGVPYSRLVRASFPSGFTLDPLYEAKVWKWARERGDDDSRSVYWVVGDSNPLRR